jgi:molecular chaperone GrpE (heat shock protein)
MSELFRRKRPQENKEAKIMRYEFLNTLKEFSDASNKQQKCLYGLVEAIGEAVILTHYEQLPALNVEVQKIEQLIGRVDALYAKVEAVDDGIRERKREDSANCSKLDIANSNLKDLRDLHTQVCRQMQELSSDSIDQLVLKPIVKDLASVYENLREKYSESGSEDIKASMEQFKVLLENYDVVIIEPNEKNKFNPAEHRAVRKYGVSNRNLDRAVRRTVQAGIMYKGKVVKQALVEVLYYKPEKPKEECDGKEKREEAGTE